MAAAPCTGAVRVTHGGRTPEKKGSPPTKQTASLTGDTQPGKARTNNSRRERWGTSSDSSHGGSVWDWSFY